MVRQGPSRASAKRGLPEHPYLSYRLLYAENGRGQDQAKNRAAFHGKRISERARIPLLSRSYAALHPDVFIEYPTVMVDTLANGITGAEPFP